MRLLSAKIEGGQLLSASLDEQIDTFIDSLRRYNLKRPHPRSEYDYEYLRRFFKDFIKDQNKRAIEVASDGYQKIAKSINGQFPVKTMFNLCIDGRVLPILTFGAPAIAGSSMRVPGGILREFVRGEDGQLKLKSPSNYANLLLRVFDLYNTDIVAEIFDSHIGCSARLSEEQEKGRNPEDSGLYADISHKRQIAKASSVFVKQRFNGQKKVLPIQTSFDPHTGFIYMGLETAQAMQVAAHNKKKITAEVLLDLVDQGLIISTERIAQQEEVEELLSQQYFHIDWKNNYIAGAERFWEVVGILIPQLTSNFEQALFPIYPELYEKTEDARMEKEERVFLLLANMLSGYLHSHHKANLENGKVAPHVHEVHYPYGAHEEQSVLISEGGYPPSEMSYFGVFSLDERNLASNVDLSAMLVRLNRKEKKVKNDYGKFPSLQEFIEASVPMVIQEVVRDSITSDEWERMASISWVDMPTNWEQMADLDFLNYLQTKKELTVGVMMGINTLRHRMATLYDLANPTSSHLIEHYKVALPVVTNRYRENKFIVPFVKLGLL